MPYQLIFLYLILVNVIGFAIMHIDKAKARKNRWRIPERTLMGIAFIGGSVGTLLGMYSARHKTKHPKFTVGVPLILAVQIIVSLLIYLYIKK